MAKHKYIETPEQMWALFEAYRKEVKSNPYIKEDYVGKDGDMVYRKIEKPLTIEGFKCYCYEIGGCDIQRYWHNIESAYDEYVTIITRIKEAIRREQLEGGMAGMYNSNLTARLNGLTDKQELDAKVDTKLEVKNITLDLT